MRAAETSVGLDRVERVLKHFGARLSDVVNVTVLLTELSEYAEFAWIETPTIGGLGA
jgi:enamine deaminase RidA (YjgF/YER057c/UK114 family)